MENNHMMRFLVSLLFGGCFILSGILPLKGLSAEKNPSEKTIWSGESGGFTIRWTSSDIQARRAADAPDVHFSVLSLARKSFESFQAAMKEPDAGVDIENCSYERSFAILSVVGSILTLKDDYYAFCHGWAHPAVASRFTAVDLTRSGEVVYAVGDGLPPIEAEISKSGKAARLTDLFPEDDILRAFLADSVVLKALKDSGASNHPTNLGQFLESVQGLPIEVGECVYRFPEDFLTQFAFHHLDKDKVAVRMGLIPAAEACRSLNAQIGILLSIPRSFQTALALAESGQEGFLMKDQRELSAGETCKVRFEADKRDPELNDAQ